MKRYNYDLDKIEDLMNKDYTMTGVARELSYCRVSLARWLYRNYNKVVKYVRK